MAVWSRVSLTFTTDQHYSMYGVRNKTWLRIKLMENENAEEYALIVNIVGNLFVPWEILMLVGVAPEVSGEL